MSCDGYVRISLEKEVSLGVWTTIYYEDQVFQVTGLNRTIVPNDREVMIHPVQLTE